MQKLKILLIEDNPFYRSLFVEVLPGYNVIKASNGKQGLELFQATSPDIVFLDINLPDASGLEILKQILADNSAAYVIMVTGSKTPDTVTEAINNGATGYITKPYSRKNIDFYIEKYCNNLERPA